MEKKEIYPRVIAETVKPIYLISSNLEIKLLDTVKAQMVSLATCNILQTSCCKASLGTKESRLHLHHVYRRAHKTK